MNGDEINIKQLRWCELVHAGFNAQQAAKGAGYKGWKLAAVRLKKSPLTQAELARLRGGTVPPGDSKAQKDAPPPPPARALMTQSRAFELLEQMSENTALQPHARIKALELLGAWQKWSEAPAAKIAIQINMGSVESEL